jgi:predicted dehydrogenase
MGQQPYKTGIVGAMRGLYHAEAYRGIENMKVQALCEVVEERLAAGVDRLGVRGYRSYEEMLEGEELDIVHVVTRPSIPRAQWIGPAVEAGVRALVLEKPIALRPSELDALCEEAAKSDIKIVVNMQRRYWPFAGQYKELVNRGRLREPHFIRANTRGGVLGMGTHLIDLILFLLDEGQPEAVWASAEGVQGYDNPEECSPDNLIAQFTFAPGVRAFLEVVQEPLGTANFPPRQELNPSQLDECNFDLWATEGRFWYRQCGTMGYWVEGMQR